MSRWFLVKFANTYLTTGHFIIISPQHPHPEQGPLPETSNVLYSVLHVSKVVLLLCAMSLAISLLVFLLSSLHLSDTTRLGHLLFIKFGIDRLRVVWGPRTT
ncbi:hypothetical protein M8J76_017315 [Diaphorina citri]|nr:hypothetical protein M8J76_017315 [Diaphorina citri]